TGRGLAYHCPPRLSVALSAKRVAAAVDERTGDVIRRVIEEGATANPHRPGVVIDAAAPAILVSSVAGQNGFGDHQGPGVENAAPPVRNVLADGAAEDGNCTC